MRYIQARRHPKADNGQKMLAIKSSPKCSPAIYTLRSDLLIVKANNVWKKIQTRVSRNNLPGAVLAGLPRHCARVLAAREGFISLKRR
jgi:hypothetical protein